MAPIRALGLLSGGLDSALAAKLLTEQGLEVIGLHLESPTSCRSDVREAARELGIELEIRPKGEAYLELLRHPRWGYGRNMNPCLDCRVFMLRLAREVMEQRGARFVFTGEVVGQRPMSQQRQALTMIDRNSDLEGWVLRPLSARLLPETEPERQGWVDRSRLLGIFGRGRSDQLRLAAEYGLRNFQSPGGGCLLTEPSFAERLRDLFAHTPEEKTHMQDVALLRLGRHIRVSAELKLVLGRNESENRSLEGFASEDRWLVTPDGFKGPIALVCGPRDQESLDHAVAWIVRYTKQPRAEDRVRWSEADELRFRPLGEAAAMRAPVDAPKDALVDIPVEALRP